MSRTKGARGKHNKVNPKKKRRREDDQKNKLKNNINIKQLM